jgi:hypothetical protein
MSAHGGPGPQGEPSEEELRAAYEAELARISATDMIAQAAVSLLNIGARRLGPPPDAQQQGEAPPPGSEQDLEQVSDAIDASMALLGVLERRIPGDQLRPLRDALSRLQMAYAAQVGSGGGSAGGPGETGAGGTEGGSGETGDGGTQGGGEPAPEGSGGEQGGPGERRPGPAESSGRLWVPGS